MADTPRRNSFDGIRQRLQVIQAAPWAQKFARSAKTRARQLLLGDRDRSFHGLLASELAKPVVVKQKDKIAFTLGIINICLTELILLLWPQHFHVWYIVWLIPLMAWRYVLSLSRITG